MTVGDCGTIMIAEAYRTVIRPKSGATLKQASCAAATSTKVALHCVI